MCAHVNLCVRVVTCVRVPASIQVAEQEEQEDIEEAEKNQAAAVKGVAGGAEQNDPFLRGSHAAQYEGEWVRGSARGVCVFVHEGE